MAFFINILIFKSTISPLNTGNIHISEDVKVGEGENQQLSVYEVRYEKLTIRARPRRDRFRFQMFYYFTLFTEMYTITLFTENTLIARKKT